MCLYYIYVNRDRDSSLCIYIFVSTSTSIQSRRGHDSFYLQSICNLSLFFSNRSICLSIYRESISLSFWPPSYGLSQSFSFSSSFFSFFFSFCRGSVIELDTRQIHSLTVKRSAVSSSSSSSSQKLSAGEARVVLENSCSASPSSYSGLSSLRPQSIWMKLLSQKVCMQIFSSPLDVAEELSSSSSSFRLQQPPSTSLYGQKKKKKSKGRKATTPPGGGGGDTPQNEGLVSASSSSSYGAPSTSSSQSLSPSSSSFCSDKKFVLRANRYFVYKHGHRQTQQNQEKKTQTAQRGKDSHRHAHTFEKILLYLS